MAGINNVTTGTGATTAKDDKPHDLKDLDINEFLKLMVTELSNQDPLNPMDNTQLMEQIGQLRSISATTQLSDTLTAVSTGQSLATATSLIGKKVDALDDDGNVVQGAVDKVTVDVDTKNPDKRSYRVHVGSKDVDLKNVRQVLP
jgi:flagellar basal-body rod modification protein FlgD